MSCVTECVVTSSLYNSTSVSLHQDSLLATPIMLDLVVLTELCQRIAVRPQGDEDFMSFHSVLALLSFLCKAPLVPAGTPVINSFFRQRACIENVMRYGRVSSAPRSPHLHSFEAWTRSWKTWKTHGIFKWVLFCT